MNREEFGRAMQARDKESEAYEEAKRRACDYIPSMIEEARQRMQHDVPRMVQGSDKLDKDHIRHCGIADPLLTARTKAQLARARALVSGIQFHAADTCLRDVYTALAANPGNSAAAALMQSLIIQCDKNLNDMVEAVKEAIEAEDPEALPQPRRKRVARGEKGGKDDGTQ